MSAKHPDYDELVRQGTELAAKEFRKDSHLAPHCALNTDALLLCPFCGEQPKLTAHGSPHMMGIEYATIRCRCGIEKTQQKCYDDGREVPEVITLWNTRASLPSAQPSDVVEAVNALKFCIEMIDNPRIPEQDNNIWSSGTTSKPHINLPILRTCLAALTTQQAQSGDVQKLVEVMRFVRGQMATELGLHNLSLGWQSGEGKARKIESMQKELAIIDDALTPFTQNKGD